MKIKLVLPSPNDLFNYKTNKADSPKVVSKELKEAKNNPRKTLTEADILSYFYNHFYGQVNTYFNSEKSLPESELNINLSREVYYQTVVGEVENATNDSLDEEKAANKLFESIKELGGNDPKAVEKLKNTMINAYEKVENEIGGNMPDSSKNILNKAVQKTNTYLAEIQSSRIDILA
jgi:hypothetical protein